MHRYEYFTQNRVFIFVIGRAPCRVPRGPQRGAMTGDKLVNPTTWDNQVKKLIMTVSNGTVATKGGQEVNAVIAKKSNGLERRPQESGATS